MADEPFLLKDLFDTEAVGVIAQAVHSAHPDFDPSRFIDDVFDAAWDDRALKARMRHIAGALRAQLPDDYRATLDILLRAAPHIAGLGFAAMVFSDFVEAYGTHDWDASVPALAEFTKVVSAEFAIRPFLAADQERTIDQLLRWTQDPNPAVRRLASEGSRPRLPWGMRIPSLIEDPRPIVPILHALRSDPDETVRRSVANSVNDIAKDHPDVALTIVSGWAETPDEHFPALCNHALRTLVKAGNTRAMELLGYAPRVEVDVEHLLVEPAAITIGDTATLSFDLRSGEERPVPVLVDYVIHYVKADGSTSPTVFKLKALELEPGSSAGLRRKLSFAQLSTRTHRPGRHRLEIQVNGAVRAGVEFELTE